MGVEPHIHQNGRAYVAGRYGDWRLIREVQAILRSRGYEITYDWTVHAEAGENERDGSMTEDSMRTAAVTDLAAAEVADLLVLVGVDDMADALGCYIEFGAAAAAGRTIHVIAPPRRSIFWHLPTVNTFVNFEHWSSCFGTGELAA